MPTHLPMGNLDPYAAAFGRLRRARLALERGAEPKPRERKSHVEDLIAELEAGAESYLEGFHAGRISDTVEGAQSYALLLRFLRCLREDEALCARWVQGEDIDAELRARLAQPAPEE